MLKLFFVRLIYWLKEIKENPMELFKELGVKPFENILEIGCAIGYHTIPLANIVKEGKIIAVDIWEEGVAFLERKTRKFPNIEIQRVSGDSIVLPSSSIDKIICFDTLHEIPNPEKAINNWVTILKDGGRFIFQDPEILPSQIQEISNNKLIETNIISKKNIFVCRK